MAGIVLIGCAASDMPPVSVPARPLSKAAVPAVAAAPSEAPPPAVEAAPPSPPPRRPGAYANLDPEDDFEVGPPEPLADCAAQLEAAGVKWAAAKIPVHTETVKGSKAGFTCGAAQVVMYLRGPGKIAYEPPPIFTCQMALALASWEKIVIEEAKRTVGARVVRVEQLGTYNCRVIPTAPWLMSEHGYANAIDIGKIFLENGKSIDIYRDFDKGEGDPKTKNGAFLRAISRRGHDEDVFSHVLTPFFDRAHDNHFHLDLARFRTDGTRPRSW